MAAANQARGDVKSFRGEEEKRLSLQRGGWEAYCGS